MILRFAALSACLSQEEGGGETGEELHFTRGARAPAMRGVDVTSGFEITNNAAILSVVRDFEPARHVQRRP